MIEIDIQYDKPNGEISHTNIERYEKDDCYCPNCGTKNVYTELGDGDYYLGTMSICKSCGAEFYLGSLRNRDAGNRQTNQRFLHLNGVYK